PRQHLHRGLGDDAERAERAGDEPRDVVAGDVLHDTPAELEHAAAAVDQLHAEHEVAQRAGRSAPRAGEPRGDAAAERRGAEVRRLERQALAFLPEGGFHFSGRRAAARGQHQLARLVVDDAGVATRVEQLAARFVAVEVLAAAAAQPQRRGARGRRADLVLQCRGRQKRASSGCGSAPPWTCMRPYSAQRASVGTALPGLSRARGSKARFTAWNSSSSSGRNCVHIWLIFSTPTPCSPVIVPPTATHFSSPSAANCSVRCSSSALLASKRMSGCRLPSPAWNTFGQRKPYFFSSSPMKCSTSPRRLRGMVPSM